MKNKLSTDEDVLLSIPGFLDFCNIRPESAC